MCLWSTNYTFLPSTLECVLTYCDNASTDSNDSGSNYNFIWDGLRVPLGEKVLYPCQEGMRVENTTEWKSEASKGSMVVCGEDGEFQYPEEWPQCSDTITCGPPLPVPGNDPRLNTSAPPATITWLVPLDPEELSQCTEKVTCASDPLLNIIAPLAEITAPLADITSPLADIIAPLGDITAPLADITASLDDITAPLADITSSLDDITAPLADITAPLDDITAPLGDITWIVSNSSDDGYNSKVAKSNNSRPFAGGIPVHQRVQV